MAQEPRSLRRGGLAWLQRDQPGRPVGDARAKAPLRLSERRHSSHLSISTAKLSHLAVKFHSLKKKKNQKKIECHLNHLKPHPKPEGRGSAQSPESGTARGRGAGQTRSMPEPMASIDSKETPPTERGRQQGNRRSRCGKRKGDGSAGSGIPTQGEPGSPSQPRPRAGSRIP